MTKIGIITFHNALNYGAFLQAFALKSFLESNSYEVKFINYESKEHSEEYKIINTRNFLRFNFRGKISLLIKALLSFNRHRKRKFKMKFLRKKYLDVQESPKFNIHLLESEIFDVIVYGSDQIWRKSSTNPGGGFDSVYWGEGFKNTKKITYAPSMGVVELNNSDKQFISTHLRNFDIISCRERNLLNELSKLTDKKITHVLDPVFLLSKSEWERYIEKRYIENVKRTHKDYVLIYNLMNSPSVTSLAERISKKFNLDIFEISGSIKPYNFQKNCFQTLDPFEFITMIHNARFVVASSFHAIAFSLLFKKDFYAIGFKNNVGRVESLLNVYKLNDRLLKDDFQGEISSIDYSLQNITTEIQKSKEFLLSALK